MIHAGVGRSVDSDAARAARQAAGEALRSLGGPADFALVFATAAYPQETLLRCLAEEMPMARISGCSAEGVISGNQTDEVDFALSVLAIRSSTVRFKPFLVQGYAGNPREAGLELAGLCAAEGVEQLAGVVILPDGLGGDASRFLNALAESLPESVPVLGGAAGDGMLFEQCFQYCDQRVLSGAVAGFLIQGDARLRFAISHGCTTIGLDRVITRAEGGWVHEIDGRPAWTVFREYLDGDPDDLTAEGIVYLCIGMRPEHIPGSWTDDYVVRTPIRLDKATGSLFFAGGGLGTGTRIRLTRRDGTLIHESARSCGAWIQRSAPAARPAFVLQFDCAGRGRILFGDRAAEEILMPLQEAFGAGIPWMGFHTYGEIAPLKGVPFFHNYSVAVCAVYEGAEAR